MLERFLESQITKILAVIVGILSGSANLLAFAFPNPEIVIFFARIGLVVVGLYLLSFIIQRLFLRSERQITYLYTSKRYGLGYDLLRIECIINDDGSAIIQRIVDVQAFDGLSKLDAFLLIPESMGGDETKDFIDFGSISSLTPGRTVSVEKVHKEWGRLSALVDIAPPLEEGESASYKMTEQLPKGLFAINLTSDELQNRKTPYDYFGWSINRPTKKLFLSIYFPEFLIPKDYSIEVRYASASSIPFERLHFKEIEHIRKSLQLTGPEGGRYSLKLEVNDPMIGLIYLIRWQPLQN